ncbi:MAG: glycosyltransferase family 4 protein [Halioglobus sp.]|nr:glycosyltransferase family 4 protein [Halioglobus sp.]
MNLIFNAEALRPPITGVGNYSYHLLAQYLADDYFDEIHCFTGTAWQSGEMQCDLTSSLKLRADLEDKGSKDVIVDRIRKTLGALPGAKPLYEYMMDRRFERYANRVSGAVYHETNYVLKPFAGPSVTTVHDLSHIRYPEYHPPNIIDWLGKQLSESLGRADQVITVSDLVRNEVLNYYDISPKKVHTVYEGVDPQYRPRSEVETAAVLSELGLQHKTYVLLVATLEPRKGIDVLLNAWALVSLELRKSYPLVLTGSGGWRNSAMVSQIKKFIAEGTVRHLGWVPSDILPVLYSGAMVFAYPSVYEGFGLPVLDAMSSGVPVVCRSGTSMAEFSETACLLCDTGEAEELALKLEALLQSSDARKTWADRGLRQAAKFSWARCARETMAIYQKIA